MRFGVIGAASCALHLWIGKRSSECASQSKCSLQQDFRSLRGRNRIDIKRTASLALVAKNIRTILWHGIAIQDFAAANQRSPSVAGIYSAGRRQKHAQLYCWKLGRPTCIWDSTFCGTGRMETITAFSKRRLGRRRDAWPISRQCLLSLDLRPNHAYKHDGRLRS